MTKILFSCLVTLFAVTANAQINKGSVLLGGDVNFGDYKNSSNYSSNSYNAGGISLSFGKAIKENKVVGISLGFSSSKQIATPANPGYDTSSQKTNRYNIGFFYRDYKKLAKDFYFFGQANAIYSYSNQKYDYNINKADSYKVVQNGGGVSIAPGIAYKVFKKMFVELSLNNLVYASYSASNTTYESSDKKLKGHDFSIGTAFSNNTFLSNIGVGFRFIL
ncbi:hypothetical protein [Pinibacter aurantiacus]|uniref:Outer membrane protein beta-barrel domain-containing protein n=1 Tax=Pinibacter aurantiacus TaxID=2851599 RepID=A0A9E2W8A1_9BACT|nr:hypothetical protein [Pinibacter aurantiacus]MBV4357812.1 hypothetical protein [Pinibacter aurantiacus]